MTTITQFDLHELTFMQIYALCTPQCEYEFLSAKGVKRNQNLSKISRVFYVHNFNWPPYKTSCDGRQWSHPSAVNLLLLSSCFMENSY